jgi:adenylate cyclase
MWYWRRTGAERRNIRQAFQKYFSPQIMEAILKEPEKLGLGGQRREVTILFADIRSFTALSEKLPPQTLTKMLQDFFTEMTDEVVANDGIVDKYIGDAIMAFWGAPIDQHDQADRAVRTAMNMIGRLKKLQERWAREGHPIFDVGIGINLGIATIGNFGSAKRFDYTLIGDAVNAAARLEGLNKRFNTHIIISDSTRRQLTIPVSVRDLGEVEVAGREEPIRVYQVEP